MQIFRVETSTMGVRHRFISGKLRGVYATRPIEEMIADEDLSVELDPSGLAIRKAIRDEFPSAMFQKSGSWMLPYLFLEDADMLKLVFLAERR